MNVQRCKRCNKILTDQRHGMFCSRRCRAAFAAQFHEDAVTDWLRAALVKRAIRGSWSPAERASRRGTRRMPVELALVHDPRTHA